MASTVEQPSRPAETIEPILGDEAPFKATIHSEYLISAPKLQILFRLECDLEIILPGRDPKHGPGSVRFLGGRFEGPKLRGTVRPGSGVWEIVDSEEATAHLIIKMELLTQDNVTINLQIHGTRTGRRTIFEILDQYYLPMLVTMQTDDINYGGIDEGVFVAGSGRVGDQILYDVYQMVV